MNGVITETNKKYSIILTNKGGFVKIPNKNYEIGQKVTYKKTNYSSLSYIAASLLIFCFLSFSGYSMYYTPDKYISVDINPSMQFEINRFNKIIEVQTFNDDAKSVLATVNVKNHNAENGIEEIIDASKRLGFLNIENNQVNINVVAKDDKILKIIAEKTKKYEGLGVGINIAKSSEEDLTLSKDLNVSIGMTVAVSEYTDVFGGDIKDNKQKLDGVSVTKIKENAKNKIEVDKEAQQKQENNKKEDENKKVTDQSNTNNNMENKFPLRFFKKYNGVERNNFVKGNETIKEETPNVQEEQPKTKEKLENGKQKVESNGSGNSNDSTNIASNDKTNNDSVNNGDTNKKVENEDTQPSDKGKKEETKTNDKPIKDE